MRMNYLMIKEVGLRQLRYQIIPEKLHEMKFLANSLDLGFAKDEYNKALDMLKEHI